MTILTNHKEDKLVRLILRMEELVSEEEHFTKSEEFYRVLVEIEKLMSIRFLWKMMKLEDEEVLKI